MTPPSPRPPSRDEDDDETGKASFPASDPPATWTWDVDRPAQSDDESPCASPSVE
jgi:hypothetical protein